ncbi:MAG: hypothetical protein Q7S44_03890 [bacterium]|nr:hypothetical protein [bacterium]
MAEYKKKIQYLPQDAEEIAKLHIEDLEIPVFKTPLVEFLRRAAAVKGLQGIVLANWDEPPLTPALSIYAFTDLRGLFDESASSRTTPAVLAPLYDQLEDLVRGGSGQRMELCYVNTLGSSFDEAFHKLCSLLSDEESEYNYHSELRFMTAAQIQPSSFEMVD